MLDDLKNAFKKIRWTLYELKTIGEPYLIPNQGKEFNDVGRSIWETYEKYCRGEVPDDYKAVIENPDTVLQELNPWGEDSFSHYVFSELIVGYTLSDLVRRVQRISKARECRGKLRDKTTLTWRESIERTVGVVKTKSEKLPFEVTETETPGGMFYRIELQEAEYVGSKRTDGNGGAGVNNLSVEPDETETITPKNLFEEILFASMTDARELTPMPLLRWRCQRVKEIIDSFLVTLYCPETFRGRLWVSVPEIVIPDSRYKIDVTWKLRVHDPLCRVYVDYVRADVFSESDFLNGDFCGALRNYVSFKELAGEHEYAFKRLEF